jgi:hypothetical protein
VTQKTGTTSKRRQSRTIRNLRGTPVHLRLFGQGNDAPYRIALTPRGNPGDTHTVPANLTDDGTFVAGIDVLFEIIPASEAQGLQYERTGGRAPEYEGETLVVVRNEENVVVRQDANLEPAPRRRLGPAMANVPGADAGIHAAVEAGQSAMPDGALTQSVSTERV